VAWLGDSDNDNWRSILYYLLVVATIYSMLMNGDKNECLESVRPIEREPKHQVKEHIASWKKKDWLGLAFHAASNMMRLAKQSKAKRVS
jgi:hypothetical protein